MQAESSYHRCEIHWKGNNTDYDSFSRLHEVNFPGGQRVQAGAAHIVQNPAQTNPEEIFAAAVGSCMMVTILAVFSKSRVTVVSYDDQPEALMEFIERRNRVTRMTLRPRIVVQGPVDKEKFDGMIQKAHANCVITLSVKSEVIVEATFMGSDER